MCLDTVIEVAENATGGVFLPIPEKDSYGYKVFGKCASGAMINIYWYSGPYDIGMTYIDKGNLFIEMEDVCYFTGYHIFARLDDAIRLARRLSEDFSGGTVVCKVKFGHVTAIGLDFDHETVVARKMIILSTEHIYPTK